MNELVIEFIEWVNKQPRDKQVKHNDGWKSCFIGMFHMHKNPNDDPTILSKFSMPIYIELDKLNVVPFGAGWIFTHSLALRTQCYKTFGDLQNYLNNEMELVK